MSNPLWELLVLTMPSRKQFLTQLLLILDRQIRAAHCDGLVKINIRESDGSNLGDQRQKFKESSTGSYIHFFDDDDLPAPDYIETIFPLLDGIDHIGFKVQHYHFWTGQEIKVGKNVIHSRSCGKWFEDADTYYRHFTTSNPMKREASLSQVIEGPNDGEDFRWANRIGDSGVIQTEHFINRVMVHYFDRHTRNDEVDWRNHTRLALIDSILEEMYRAKS